MYILECSDASYYTGSTIDLELRLQQHQSGEGANHTKKRLPVKLVYYEVYDRIDEAFYREKQVQGWSRKKKETLIENRPQDLLMLSRNYTQYGASTSSASDSTSSATNSTSNGDVASTSSATATSNKNVASTSSGTATSSGTDSTSNGDVASTSSATATSNGDVASTSSGTDSTSNGDVASTSSATIKEKFSVTDEKFTVAEPVEATVNLDKKILENLKGLKYE